MPDVILEGGTPIASYTFIVIRGGVVQVPFTFLNGPDDPENTLSASIIITPTGAGEVQWTQANGLFPQTGAGEYVTDLDEAYTTALAWDFGRYRIEIVDGSGFTVPCITEGLIFIQDC